MSSRSASYRSDRRNINSFDEILDLTESLRSMTERVGSHILKPGISICIPTFERPAFLLKSIESCVAQRYRPLEIIVSDDSPGNESELLVKAFRDATVTISYRRNNPPLGQNENVAKLFHLATQPRLLLLHDDDVLLPDAIELLDEPWNRFDDVKITFGKQQIIDETGVEDLTATEKHNRSHRRTAEHRGPVGDPLRAALLLQLPNDGFLIESMVARTVGYRSFEKVGVYCDKDFALRLGRLLHPKQMYYVDQPVSQYRTSTTSISNATKSRKSDHPTSAVLIYENLPSLKIPDALRTERDFLVVHMIDKLVKGYALARRRGEAAGLYFSKQYGWRRRISGRGIYHLALIADPRIDKIRPYGASAMPRRIRDVSQKLRRFVYKRSAK